MNILLAFAPFIVFAILERLAGPTTGLVAAAVVSLLILLRDWLVRRRSGKVLEIGSLLLFSGLAIYGALTRSTWSLWGVRLCVDAGLLLIVLVSMLIRRPFTLQYARETAPPNMWGDSVFIRTNYVITAAWALAFAAMTAADLVMLYVPGLPVKVGVGVTIIALVTAIRFTSQYPIHVRNRALRNTSVHEIG